MQIGFAWVEDYLVRSDGKMIFAPSLAERATYLTIYRYGSVASSSVRTPSQSLVYFCSVALVASMFMEDIFLVVFVWHFHTENNISDLAL
ncbi:MAG: hypothetical protein KGL95_14155 [Patescibacteria group bacterium]|nr:hypothetical protein [Patescibacteria group bacterium]